MNFDALLRSYVVHRIFISLLLSALPLGAQRTDAEVIDQAVVQQTIAYCSASRACQDAVRSEYIGGSGSTVFSPLVRPSLLRAGLRVFRAKFSSIDHVPEYIIAMHEGEIWRLGGFPSPDIFGFVQMLDLNGDSEDLVNTALMLAVMLDVNGALGIVGGDGSRLAGAVDNATFLEGIALWQRDHPGMSMRDTIRQSVDSLVVVSVNVISASRTIDDIVWRPVHYAFVFDNNGHLISWDRRFGEVMIRVPRK